MKLRSLSAAAIACALALSITAADAKQGNHHNHSGATTSRACLTVDTAALLEAAEAHFGVTFKLVSTCRPGAVIAGSGGEPSLHRYGRAVDLLVRGGIAKSKVVSWLYEHARGVVMTYYNMAHIHFDTGTYHKLIRNADAYGGHWPKHLARHPDRRHQAQL